MIRVYKIVALLVFPSIFISCNKSDSGSYDLRDRQTVYDEDILEIEEYLQTHYMTVDANMNAVIDTILPTTTEASIWSQTAYPLQSITVKNDTRDTYLTDGLKDDDVDYKLYYIVLNDGGGNFPTNVDSTFVAYRGWNMENEMFDQNVNGSWFSHPDTNGAISGFRQILSKVKTASSFSENSNGSITYFNYGNVVVFIPSGLAYFNGSNTNIGTYSPIAFQINLFSLKERDHDKDRILSKYEDLNNNGDYFDDDTDGDKLPDFLDFDDDGDGRITKKEIEISTGNYYEFANIPLCPGGNGKKKHLDPFCQ
ncbi:MAG: FKBP-type peptidyl-prolyl cis-trans isomerase [Flavobacterium sp.]|uniref:FKBP-type peptidyl-prolyl cis-trans isomerase n=1 Tax=Flavobacterium sp. TaxID=239 RepID=UPI00378AFD35